MSGMIPQSFIDDLLDRIDIVDTVDSRVKLRKTGKNYVSVRKSAYSQIPKI